MSVASGRGGLRVLFLFLEPDDFLTVVFFGQLVVFLLVVVLAVSLAKTRSFLEDYFEFFHSSLFFEPVLF